MPVTLTITCREMAHKVSRWPLTMDDQVHAQFTPCGILWWTNWHWVRMPAPQFFPSLLFRRGFILFFWGVNRPTDGRCSPLHMEQVDNVIMTS